MILSLIYEPIFPTLCYLNIMLVRACVMTNRD